MTFEWKLGLGEALNAAVTLWAAWYVGSRIQKKLSNERVLRDTMCGLCSNAVSSLDDVSKGLAEACAKPGAVVSDAGRLNIGRLLQRYSNAIHTIELALREAAIEHADAAGHERRMDEIDASRRELAECISEPLAQRSSLDALQLRKVEGAHTRCKDALVALHVSLLRS